MIRKKILLLGDFSVGKTSLVRRYVDGAFDDKYLTTIGVKIAKRYFDVEGVDYELIIWDIEGSTPNKKIALGYYKGASGAICVADITRKDTLEGLKEHQKIFLNENPRGKVVTAYNKSDLLSEVEKAKITLDDNTFFTSAKDNIGVEEVFLQLLRQLIE